MISDDQDQIVALVAELEHIQNALRVIYRDPSYYGPTATHLEPIRALMTALKGRTDRWVHPREQERRVFADRRQMDRRERDRRVLPESA